MHTKPRQMSFQNAALVILTLALQLLAPWPITGGTVLATPPTITSQPQNKSACDSGNPTTGRAVFFCGATGTQPLSFQWRRGTTNLTNVSNISGATSNALAIWPCQSPDAAPDYNCLITNAEGSAVTNYASLTVWPTGTGDVNGDGAVNGLDIQSFVGASLALAPASGAMTASFCAADMDGNGSLGCEDLCVFVQELLQSPLGCGVPPDNDDCLDAILISTGVIYSGDTAYATRDGPHASCEFGCSPQCNTSPDVWFKWVADFTGAADFSMCDASRYDTLLVIYDGCPSIGGVQLFCNDDGCGDLIWSRIFGSNTLVNAGQTYWICVSGWGGSKGCFSLRVSPYTGS
jgi:hypothetical protein